MVDSEDMRVPAVVLDTNVFIAAAFKPRSDSGRVVDAVRSGTLRLVWNEARDGKPRGCCGRSLRFPGKL